MRSGTIDLVKGFRPGDDARATKSRRLTLELLDGTRAPFDRTTFDPGHITASALVLSPRRDRVLLVYHRRLERWLQPGGHVEPTDVDVVATAQREVLEETGLVVTKRDMPLVGVDVHDIPPAGDEPAHLHHDLMFGTTARAEEVDRTSLEPMAVWCAVSDLDRYGIDVPLRRALERALHPSQ